MQIYIKTEPLLHACNVYHFTNQMRW